MVLEAERARFLSDKAALVVGAVDASGRPFATRGWGLEVLDAAGGRSRLLLARDELPVFGHLAGAGRIAVTGTDVLTLRGCQLKGAVEAFEPVTEHDLEHSAHYCEGFFGDVETADGFPAHLLDRLRPDVLVACLFTVDEVYDQTPGPHAGVPLHGGPT